MDGGKDHAKRVGPEHHRHVISTKAAEVCQQVRVARPRQAGLSEGHLRLLVEDDGVGLGAAGGSRTGNGLANMQRRATHMGGSVEVVDRGTQGTVVHIAIPIAAARPKR